MSDADYEARATSSVSQVLRAIGGWGKASGRGLFMFRSLMVGTTTAAIVGLSFASVGSITMGVGGLGFVVGSCVGFVGATMHYYMNSLRQALQILRQHPRLMQLHLAANFPMSGFLELPVEELDQRYFNSSLGRQGMLIAAWQNAGPALEDIHDRREQALITLISTEEEAELNDVKTIEAE